MLWYSQALTSSCPHQLLHEPTVLCMVRHPLLPKEGCPPPLSTQRFRLPFVMEWLNHHQLQGGDFTTRLVHLSHSAKLHPPKQIKKSEPLHTCSIPKLRDYCALKTSEVDAPMLPQFTYHAERNRPPHANRTSKLFLPPGLDHSHTPSCVQGRNHHQEQALASAILRSPRHVGATQ